MLDELTPGVKMEVNNDISISRPLLSGGCNNSALLLKLMSSATCLRSQGGYPLDLNFWSSWSKILMKAVCEEVHLRVLMISPLSTVLNVVNGWQELKCKKHCGFVCWMCRLVSKIPFSRNLWPL